MSVYRCPECQYTHDDAARFMDHHICEAEMIKRMDSLAA